jgi:hypothetical protein
VAFNAETPYMRDFCVNKLIDAVMPEDLSDNTEVLLSAERSIWPAQVTGIYLGSGEQAFRISHEAGKLIFSFENNASTNARANSFVLETEEEAGGAIRLIRGHAPLSVGFFRSAELDSLNVMIGCNAYKKNCTGVSAV